MDRHEPRVERIILEATEAGFFDDLDGMGQPIPDIDEPYDPGWWARRWYRRQRLQDDLEDAARHVQRPLPVVLALQAEAADMEGLESMAEEVEVVNRRAGSAARLESLPIERLLAVSRSRRRAGGDLGGDRDRVAERHRVGDQTVDASSDAEEESTQ